MQNPIKSLKARCAVSRIPVSELCRRAGVNNAMVSRWLRHTPKTIKTLQLLHDVCEQIERERKAEAGV